jgi:serine/threonine protein kinase
MHNFLYFPLVIDFFNDDSTIYIVMEYAEKGDLVNYNKKNTITSEFINKVIYQTTCGLRDLHNFNIIHRDIKPANILVFENNNIKITDFGVSSFLNRNEKNAYTVTGTLYYMSNEILNGYSYTSATDFWSLGCMIYELLTKERPFNTNNYFELLSKIKKCQYDINKITEPYKNLIKNLLLLDPSKRYTSNQVFRYYVKYIYKYKNIKQSLPRNKVIYNKDLLNKKLPNIDFIKKKEVYNEDDICIINLPINLITDESK